MNNSPPPHPTPPHRVPSAPLHRPVPAANILGTKPCRMGMARMPIIEQKMSESSSPAACPDDRATDMDAERPRPRLRPTPNRKGLCETLSCARPGQSAPPIRSAVVVGSRSRNHQRKLANSLPLLMTDPMCHLPSANRRREDAARKEGKRPLPNPNPSFRRILTPRLSIAHTHRTLYR